MRIRQRKITSDENGLRFWSVVESERELNAGQTAVLLCDVWDGHWCHGAVERLELMLPTMNKVVTALRGRGASIIHAPSGTLGFYADSPAVARIESVPKVPTPKPANRPDPPLPIDDSDGGGDSDNDVRKPNVRYWTRQHPDIHIDEERDVISDNGEEIYSYLADRGLQTVLFMGVHTNICVLLRSFGIKNLVRWGVDTILCRDLTDAMYNPASAPYVSHHEGTNLVIEYIEKFWCPSTTSGELLSIAPAKQTSADHG